MTRAKTSPCAKQIVRTPKNSKLAEFHAPDLLEYFPAMQIVHVEAPAKEGRFEAASKQEAHVHPMHQYGPLLP